jgi:hypothetical protein
VAVSIRSRNFAAFLLAILVSLGSARFAVAGPNLGFLEDWPGVGLSGWTAEGTSVLVNPGNSGASGVGDGYLSVSLATPGALGARSLGAEYAGDWLVAGIQLVRVWLRDTGAFDDLEIHFGIGNAQNLWLYTPGLNPPTDHWQQFAIDLTSPQGFVQIAGTGTFADAMHAVDRVFLRHDRAPFTATPDAVRGEFGIDRVTLTDAITTARATTWGRVKALYR